MRHVYSIIFGCGCMVMLSGCGNLDQRIREIMHHVGEIAISGKHIAEDPISQAAEKAKCAVAECKPPVPIAPAGGM